MSQAFKSGLFLNDFLVFGIFYYVFGILRNIFQSKTCQKLVKNSAMTNLGNEAAFSMFPFLSF